MEFIVNFAAAIITLFTVIVILLGAVYFIKNFKYVTKEMDSVEDERIEMLKVKYQVKKVTHQANLKRIQALNDLELLNKRARLLIEEKELQEKLKEDNKKEAPVA